MSGQKYGRPVTAADAAVCRYVRRWINVLRSDLCVAISLDKLLKLLNGYLKEVGYGNLEAVTVDDLKKCLNRDRTVEIFSKDGKEVVWLWSGQRRRELINRIVDVAVKEEEVAWQ